MVLNRSITFDEGELAVSASRTTTAATAEDAFVERLRSGEPEAFDQLIIRYAADINAILMRITEDADEAGELTQETFLSALKSIGTFRGDSELKTWLIRIAVNHSRNRFRWWKRRGKGATVSLDTPISGTDVVVGDTLESASKTPEERAIIAEQQRSLRQALLDLPEIFREAVVLCDIEGLTYDEIADALGISLGTVKSRIARGREELRRRLKDI